MILAYDSFRPGTFLDAFRFIGDNPGLMWSKTVEHLQISGLAMAIALLIAIPLGVWLGHLHRGAFIAINLANVGRALPSLAVIAIGLGVFGIGTTNVVVALVVLAFPLMLTNTFVGVDGVDPDAIEAARGMGMRPIQIVLKVELPLALPAISAGIRIAVVTTISLATVAAYITPLGLGQPIFNGLQTDFTTEFVATGALAVALAIAADSLLVLVQRALTPWVRARRTA